MVPKPLQSAVGGGQLTGSSKLGFSTRFCPCNFAKTKMHPMSKVELLMDIKLKGSPCSCANAATRLDLLFDKFAGQRPGLRFQEVGVNARGQAVHRDRPAQVGFVHAHGRAALHVENQEYANGRKHARFVREKLDIVCHGIGREPVPLLFCNDCCSFPNAGW
jgi:hypothetical protein